MDKRFLIHGLCLSVVLVISLGLAFYSVGFLFVSGVCLAFFAFVTFLFLLIRRSRSTKSVPQSSTTQNVKIKGIKTNNILLICTSCLLLCILLAFCIGHYLSEEPVDIALILTITLPQVLILIGLVSHRKQIYKNTDNKLSSRWRRRPRRCP